MIVKGLRCGFSTIAKKTFEKFNQRYLSNIEEFKKKVGATANEGDQIKKSTQRAYVHPYHDGNKGVFYGINSALQSYANLIGPEQVSPHYEHFSFARRQALIFFGGMAVLRWIAHTEDFYMFAYSGTYAWTFYFGASYFWL